MFQEIFLAGQNISMDKSAIKKFVIRGRAKVCVKVDFFPRVTLGKSLSDFTQE